MTADRPFDGRIAVIAVNWNSWADTVNVHRSLMRSTIDRWSLIVVDNASSDDSADQLERAALANTRIIRNPVNGGFAGGCNVGIRAALAGGASHVFLLNNDAEVAPDCLERLLAASVGLGDTAILGPVVRFHATGEIQFMGSDRSEDFGHPVWKVAPIEPALGANGLIDSDFVFGAALFSPAALFRDDHIGLLDERFFLNYEETDWCYRAARAGVRCWVVPDATVLHHSSVSLGAIEAPMQRYFLTRNELLFSELHGSARERRHVAIRTTREVARRMRRRIRGRERLDGADQATLLAVRDYLIRRFGDCPPRVRELARRARGTASAPPLAPPTP